MGLIDKVVTAALSASLVSLILLDAASIHLVIQKLELYAYGWALMLFGRDKRWASLKIDRGTIAAMDGVRRKRLILVRHGESEWNLVFNVGSKLLVPFKAAAALWRELMMFVHLDPGSVLYDSPLNQSGLEQAQEIAAMLRDEASTSVEAAIMRGDKHAPETSVVTTSNLRRAAQTMAIAMQDRLSVAAAATPTKQNSSSRLHVLSFMQEISTNVDTVSITPPHTPPVLPRVPELLQSPSLFENSFNYGNKTLRGNGLERIVAFTRWCFKRDEETIIVGGHSLWFRALFRELLPQDESHESKDTKIANGGIVSCYLEQGYSNGQLIYVIRPETIVTVHKGFEVKKQQKKKKSKDL